MKINICFLEFFNTFLFQGLEAPFTLPECELHPVGDMFSPIPVLPSMKCKPLKIKIPNALRYNPSWETGAKSVSNKPERNMGVLRLPAFYSKHILANTQISLQVPLDTSASNTSITNSDLKIPLDCEVAPQVISDKANMNDAMIAIEASKSVELILRFRDAGNVTHNNNTDLLQASPYQQRFKHDQILPYDIRGEDTFGLSKQHRPKRPNDLPLESKGTNSTDHKQAELPSRTLELFREQWLSPFSMLYLTRILSRFYGISTPTTAQTLNVSPNTALELLFEINPRIEDALRKSLRRRSWDVNKTDSPTSFQDLHRLAGRTAQQSNLPVQPLLIGAEGDLVSVSPNCLKHWKKLSIEPYGGPRDVAYVVVAPDSDLVLENTKLFFRELSGLYEVMALLYPFKTIFLLSKSYHSDLQTKID